MKRKPTSKVRVKKVRAYILLSKNPMENDSKFEVTFPIYTNKKDAEQVKSVYRLRYYKVVPATISFSLPTQPKGKKK